TTWPVNLGTDRALFHSALPRTTAPIPAAVPATPNPAADASKAFLKRIEFSSCVWLLGFFPGFYLSEVQNRDNGYPSANVARRRQPQPLQAMAERHNSGNDRRHNFTGAGNAVCEVSQTYD